MIRGVQAQAHARPKIRMVVMYRMIVKAVHMYTSSSRSRRRLIWRSSISGGSRGSLVGGGLHEGEVVGGAEDRRRVGIFLGRLRNMLEMGGRQGGVLVRGSPMDRADELGCRRVEFYKFSSDPGRRAVQM